MKGSYFVKSSNIGVKDNSQKEEQSKSIEEVDSSKRLRLARLGRKVVRCYE